VNHDKLFVRHDRVVLVGYCCSGGIPHLLLRFSVGLFALKVATSRAFFWQLKLKWNGVISGLQWLAKSVAGTFKVKVFLGVMRFVPSFVGILPVTCFLFTFHLNFNIFGIYNLISTDVYFSIDDVTSIVKGSIGFDVEITA